MSPINLIKDTHIDGVPSLHTRLIVHTLGSGLSLRSPYKHAGEVFVVTDANNNSYTIELEATLGEEVSYGMRFEGLLESGGFTYSTLPTQDTNAD